MDPQKNIQFISLLPEAPSRVIQAPPLPRGIGGALSPMMIPLGTSDAVHLSSFSTGQPTINMLQQTTMAGQMMMPQSLAPPTDIVMSAPAPIQPLVPPVSFYKCSTGMSRDESTCDVHECNRERASLDSLQEAYKELNSRKIKDPLSSFLPDIPGDFDSTQPPGTMLLDLVEHKPIGGKEFLPLSGQALLGFRLLPGPLPEQFRIDPPTMNSHSKSRKKKKHKHKNIDRAEEKTDPFHATPKPSKLPSDAYSFIKHESHISPFTMTTSETVLHVGGGGGGGISSIGGSVVSAGQMLQQQQVYTGAGTAHLVGVAPQILGDKKKKKKRDKEKKKKDKKKRRHHTQQDPLSHPSSHPPPHPPHPTPPPPSSSTATPHFPHPHT